MPAEVSAFWISLVPYRNVARLEGHKPIPRATHSNDLELAAALMMMDHLIPQVLPGASFVDLMTDNTNVARWIATLSCKVKDSGSDKERAQWLHAAGLHQAERNIYFHCRQEDLESNTWADALSKPELREGLFRLWHTTNEVCLRVNVSTQWSPLSLAKGVDRP